MVFTSQLAGRQQTSSFADLADKSGSIRVGTSSSALFLLRQARHESRTKPSRRVFVGVLLVLTSGRKWFKSLPTSDLDSLVFLITVASMKPNRNSDRIVFLLSGVSGAGKTTLAKEKKAINERAGVPTVVVSADDYFVGEDGVYRHDRDRLPAAHQQCFSRFCAALAQQTPVVIVDNTNTRSKQREPYVAEGSRCGYAVVHILVGSLDQQFLDFAAARSVHQKDVEFTKLVAAGYQKPDDLVVVKGQTVGFRP